MNPAQRGRGLVGVAALLATASLLWSGTAHAVPVTTGSSFTSSSTLVDYFINKNVGFGNDATLPAGTNGFDLIPDLTAFAVAAPTVAQGEFDFTATGVNFGALNAVINELMFTMAGSYSATGPGTVTIQASMDVVNTTTGQVTFPLVFKNFFQALSNGSTWSHTADWLETDFPLAVGQDIISLQVSIDVFLTADGFGPAQMNEAMAITDTSLVPVVPTAPEPSSTALLVLGGLAGLAARKRFHR